MLSVSTKRSLIKHVPYEPMQLNCYTWGESPPTMPYKAPTMPGIKRTPRTRPKVWLPPRLVVIEPCIEYIADVSAMRHKIAALKAA